MHKSYHKTLKLQLHKVLGAAQTSKHTLFLLLQGHRSQEGRAAEQPVNIGLHLQAGQHRGVGVQSQGLVHMLCLGLKQLLQLPQDALTQLHGLVAVVTRHLALVCTHTLKTQRMFCVSSSDIWLGHPSRNQSRYKPLLNTFQGFHKRGHFINGKDKHLAISYVLFRATDY